MASAPLEARLAHAIDAVERIEALWSGKTFDDYTGDPVLAAATERFLERICEAVKHVPDQLKADHPEIRWAQIRGLGNRLRHGYDAIDDEVIWDIVEKDLGPLRAALVDIHEKAADP